ncbi:hypothetical protein MMC25_003774 [Agyrium rufum]|nr:hypothetical protein [Agyrium rufum]
MLALIGLFGALFLKRRNQRVLLKSMNHSLQIYELSSWMNFPQVVLYWFKTRKFPAGYYGVLMLVVGGFGLTSHIFVSRFVLAGALEASCFTQVGIVVYNQTVIPAHEILPNAGLGAANIAITAQQMSMINAGPSTRGIYQYAVDHPSFFGKVGSINNLGSWHCLDVLDDRVYPQSMNQTDIYQAQLKAGLLYPAAHSFYEYSYLNHSTLALFLWSTSVATTAQNQVPWKVKFGYTTDLHLGGNLTITTYDCEMDAPRASSILNVIPSNTTMLEWEERIYGLIDSAQEFGVASVNNTVELALNAMVMTAGAGNNIYNDPDDPDTGLIYDCIAPYTQVAKEIIIAFVVVFLILLFMITAECLAVCMTCCRRHKSKVQDVPGDLASWQVAVLNDVFMEDAEIGGLANRRITEKQIPNYSYGWIKGTDGHDRVGYKRVGDSDLDAYRRSQQMRQYSSVPSNLGGPGATPGAASAMSQDPFLKANTHYDSFNAK